MESPQTFLRFESRTQALPLMQLLDQNGIPYQIHSDLLDKTYSEIPSSNPISILMPPEFLEKATVLVRSHFPEVMETDEDLSIEVPDFTNEKQNISQGPEEVGRLLALMGYLASLLGGIPGIFLGLHWLRYRKFLDDGTEIHAFGPLTRKHGNNFVLIGLIALGIWGFVIYKKFVEE